MRPNFHPRLINDPFGDPGLFVETLHRRGAFLFDLGDLAPLPARDLLRVGHVFVTHTHIDHFIGFDALLRVLVGRERRILMVGPQGFADRVGHKLLAYEWDLVDRYATDLVFDVTELHDGGRTHSARFRFKRAFRREELPDGVTDGLVAAGEGFEVRAALLEHHGPSVGYVLAEPAHVNIWRNRLAERGLSPGHWLQALKRAVIEGAGDDHPIALPDGREAPLGSLRAMLSVTPGQKIAYVTDVADTPANRQAIAALARGADILFLESRFAAEDEAQARQRAHLTTRAAGEIARLAGVRRLEPFHFSPRYEDRGAQSLVDEVAAAFAA
jgi:ribonuclease Z